MLRFFSLLLGDRFWKLHSRLIRFILICYGMKIGRRLLIKGLPKLKINGKPSNIIIGDDVSILGEIDIRNRENGRLVISDGVTIEHDCRFVSAREGTISIGKGTVIGAYAVFNGGADIAIGRQCLFAVRTSINSNDHLMSRQFPIREQGFVHEPVTIEEDCWIGVNVAINKGVRLRRGSVIGANAVVTKDTTEYSINAGIPARKIGERL